MISFHQKNPLPTPILEAYSLVVLLDPLYSKRSPAHASTWPATVALLNVTLDNV